MSIRAQGDARSSGEWRPSVGDRIEVDIGGVAHGGHMVARPRGFVLFVRHALPGERVVVQITDVRAGHGFAETVRVIEPHAERRDAPCPAFHAFGCGGCDFQHAQRDLQLRMKGEVLREALTRHGRLDGPRVADLTAEGVVALGPEHRWRSRMRFVVAHNADGKPVPGLHVHRSSQRVIAQSCTISDPGIVQMAQQLAPQAGDDDVIVIAVGDDGVRAAIKKQQASHREPGSTTTRVHHRVLADGQAVDFHIAVDGFWQSEPRLLPALIATVLDFGRIRPGQHWWDLYAGSGPLAAALGVRVGTGGSGGGSVQSVEADPEAVRAARRALHAMPWIRLHQAKVTSWLEAQVSAARSGDAAPVSGIVLDPPRSGAGADVVDALAAIRAPILVYVACDPVALGRDCARLEQQGYRLTRLRAWDAFPQSHHFETVAAFERADQIS